MSPTRKSRGRSAEKSPKPAANSAPATKRKASKSASAGRSAKAAGSSTRDARAVAEIEVAELGLAGKVRTVIYIHGIRNHPDEPQLKAIWDQALFQNPMGERTRMAWWVDRSRYPQPPRGDEECGPPARAPDNGVRMLTNIETDPFRAESSELLIQQITDDPEAQQFLRELDASLRDADRAIPASGGVGAKGAGDFTLRLGNRITSRLLLPDVFDFFFREERRQRMREIFRDRLRYAGPCIVIAHSQGSMIAYDVLRELGAADADVQLFVTLGSPLGLPPVRERFRSWTGKKRLPWPPCVRHWHNYAHPRDIVAADADLADDVQKGPDARTVQDVQVRWSGLGSHSICGYLAASEVRTQVLDAVGPEFAQLLSANLAIAGDLVCSYEAAPDSERVPVLIEVRDSLRADPFGAGADDRAVAGIAPARATLREAIERIASTEADQLGIQELDRFIAARLNRAEIEQLRHEAPNLPLQRVWRNAVKRALIETSLDIVQARSAHLAYRALGQGIRWAVLDTGVDARHPHFRTHSTIAAQFDCTRRGPIAEMPATASSDANGHGTHVCGIVAGEFALDVNNRRVELSGIAPRAELVSYKVLGDDGFGEDAFIIKALDHVARINEEAGQAVIQGVNLSLGGSFDPSVFGCGHTPLCNELRRLWRQGVLVVIAAGNEGFQELSTRGGASIAANIDLSIGDPANLEDAIAVGSVHRERPHTYGISYFSSRGPTADGRVKPDLVAPGEKVLSARHFPRALSEQAIRERIRDVSDGYVQLSGTSMAAPHVSGALAAFLSVRREFIGHPDRVKALLLAHATDLGRDRYFQGAGLLNLTRMLALG